MHNAIALSRLLFLLLGCGPRWPRQQLKVTPNVCCVRADVTCNIALISFACEACVFSRDLAGFVSKGRYGGTTHSLLR